MTEFLGVLRLAGGTCALLVTLPGTLEILLVTIGSVRKTRRPAGARARELRLAIVVPAHNEAPLIARCVESIAASAGNEGNCRIVVVADNCTDDTAERAAEAGAQVLVRQNTELRGKGYALRLAFDSLWDEGFEGFLVVDADSVVSSGLVAETRRHLAAGASASQCRYRVSNDSASLRTRLMDVAFLAFNVVRPKGRSGWGLSCGILGNGFALSRKTLQDVPYDASSIVEDLEYHLRLIAAGKRVVFIDEASVFGEIPTDGDAARIQRARWEGGRMRMVREWAPGLALRTIHGKWRMLEPLLEMLTLPLAYHVLLLALACLLLRGDLRVCAAASLWLVAFHVLRAAFAGGQLLKTALALAAAPVYIFWKITTLGAVFSASRRDAHWVRTGRKNETF